MACPGQRFSPPPSGRGRRSGHVPIRILQRSGALVRSILADWSPAQAVAGANLVYAAAHQFGDPERNILARPFLGASNENNRFIIDTLIRHIDPNRPHATSTNVAGVGVCYTERVDRW